MGTRSFDLVDYKVAEAEFFLERLASAGGDFFGAGCYFSAFASAARSVTFSLQSVLSDAPEFGAWYAAQQDRLRRDVVARFFHEVRRIGQHIGVSPVRGGSVGPGKPWTYSFTPSDDFPVVPDIDVASACRHYMHLLVEVVFDCYLKFGELIDPHQYYTKQAFEKRGLTIEDAEAELVRAFVGISDYKPSILQTAIPLDYRWQMVRDSVPGCRIDDLFDKYLSKARPGPPRLDPPPPESIALPPGWTRKDGWILPPGYDDIETYLDAFKAGTAPRNW